MQNLEALQTLTHWFSPSYPLGSFAYSYGLEAAIALGYVQDQDSVTLWIKDLLRYGGPRNDAIFLAHSYRGEDVAALARALAGSTERLRETLEQGASFVRATPLDLTPQPFPIVLGQAAAKIQAPLNLTIALYLQAFITNLVTCAIKSVPLGQTAGQNIIRELLPLCAEIAHDCQNASLDDLGGAAFSSDLCAIWHETLEPRIYRT